MIQFVVGAAAGYVMGTKAGRKRYHQIVNATQSMMNSPVTKQVTTSARKAIANRIDPEPRMREVKDARTDHTSGATKSRKLRGRKNANTEPQIFEPDED